jgi:hypothetical protein
LRTAICLTNEESVLAGRLIRGNLKCRHSHIISGTGAVGDLESVPTLRAMLLDDPEESRRLVIAGALWKLHRDPAFIEY